MSLEGMQLGHYRLLRLIGSGGMGEVYLGEDTRITRQVAIKVVRTESATQIDENKEAERLFQREMKAITLLDHAHILPLYDFGEEPGPKGMLTYMVMPYRSEGSLADWLHQRHSDKPLSPQDVAYLLFQAAEAIQHAHDHQIIHQDIKPPNFLIRQRASMPNRPDLLLADFGTAKFMTARAAISQNIRGTPLYMPPEQWEGRPVPATDQYALGVMAYHLLTGHTLFTGRMEQIMRQHFTVIPQPPSKLNGRLPAALDAVVLRALSKSPADRFPSVIAFARAFQQAIAQTVDLRATLPLRPEEAQQGANRTLTLPGGRRISVAIPAGARNGQVLRIDGQGEPYYEGGPRGPLQLTLALSPTNEQDSQAAGANLVNAVPMAAHASPHVDRTAPPFHISLSSPGITAPTAPPSPPAPVPPPYINMHNYNMQAISSQNISGPPVQRPQRKVMVIAPVAILLILFSITGTFVLINYQNTMHQANVAATGTTTAQNASATASSPTEIARRATLEALANNTFPPYLSNPGSDTGALSLLDPLKKPAQWSRVFANSDWGGECRYSNNAYTISQTKTNRFYHCTGQPVFNDFALEVQMKILQGNCGGMSIRNDSNGQNGNYVLSICQNGEYAIDYYPDNKDGTRLRKAFVVAEDIKETNTIAVKARGTSINLYLNQKWIAGVEHDALQRGPVGFAAIANTQATTVEYRNVRAWTL